MDNRALADLLKKAGLGDVRIDCRAHAGRPARCFCEGCRAPLCLDCVALRDRALRCAECARRPAGRRAWFATPMGASAACIALLTLASVFLEGVFRRDPPQSGYTYVPESGEINRAMVEIFHAQRLREGAEALEAHGEPGRAAHWRRRAHEAYARFESLYPRDDDRLRASLAVSAARYARAQSEADYEAIAREFPREPAGILATLRIARRRVQAADASVEAPLREPRTSLIHEGGFGERAAKAYASQQGSQRRVAIEKAAGIGFSVSDARAEVASLLGQLCESGGRATAAIDFYQEALKHGDDEAARARLAALRSTDETMTVERIGD